VAKAEKPVRPAKSPRPAKAGKAAKASAPAGLPVCIAMLVCEQVIIAKDNTASAIRIVDTITLPSAAERKQGEGLEFGLHLLIIVKKGDSQGQFDLLLVCTDPNGNKVPVGLAAAQDIQGGPETGTTSISPLRLPWGGEGLYWIELLANNSLIARTPVKVNIGTLKSGEESAGLSAK